MNICQEANEHAERNRSKDLFETVNRLTRETCPTVRVVKDEKGQTLTENGEILERWKEYCETLYKDNTSDTYEVGTGPREPAPTLHQKPLGPLRHFGPARVKPIKANLQAYNIDEGKDLLLR